MCMCSVQNTIGIHICNLSVKQDAEKKWELEENIRMKKIKWNSDVYTSDIFKPQVGPWMCTLVLGLSTTAISGYISLAKASDMVTLGFKSGYTYRADLRCHEHLRPLDTFSRVCLWGHVSVVTEGPQDASRNTACQPSWVQIQALWLPL